MTSTPPAFVEHDFRKASASQPNKECVRVARREGWVELRDDKATFGAADDLRLVLTEPQFDTFLADVRSGQTADLCLKMTQCDDGTYTFRSTTPQPSGASTGLRFTESEVLAFLDGVTRGEFDRDPTPDVVVSA